MSYTNLFTPIELGSVHVRNRIFMPPMHPNLSESPNGHYTKRYIDYYAERAKNGVGLILTGHVKAERKIDPYPAAYKFPCLDKVDEIKYFTELVDTVHMYGAKIAVELSAGTGRIADQLVDDIPAPSASSVPMLYVPGAMTRELTVDEIHELVASYGRAAANAKAAGFDLIYIHAMAYLMDQFLTPAWNHRTDEYGGSLENRMRFMMECIDSARAAVGPRFPLMAGFSLDQGIEGSKTMEDCIAIAKALEAKGIVALHVRNGSYDAMNVVIPSNIIPKQTSVENAAKIKAAVTIPVLTDGALLEPDVCEEIIGSGKVDMTGVGRPLLADPEWPVKAQTGRADEIRPCIRCMECLHRATSGLFSGCSVNPVMGRECEKMTGPAPVSKKVLVIGGGQSGLLSAIYASQRGHKVVLAEKSNHLGGHMLESSIPYFKEETRKYVKWVLNEIDKADVEVHTGVTVDRAYVDSIKPDAIIVCTGSKPMVPPAEGMDNAKVDFAINALVDPSTLGDKVVIVGSGLVGVETALDLRNQGKDVTIVEMLPEIGQDIILTAKFPMLSAIYGSDIKCMPATRLVAVTDEGAVVENAESGKITVEADNVLLAAGLKADNAIYDELIQDYPQTYLVGDAVRARKFYHANREAYSVAMAL